MVETEPNQELSELGAHIETLTPPDLVALNEQLQKDQELLSPEEVEHQTVEKAMEIFAVRARLHDLGLWDSINEYSENIEDRLKVLKDEALDRITLKNKFNISNPDRYPADVLKKMLEDQNDTHKPWGIVVVADASADHNGAFERNPELQGLCDDLEGRVALRIVEASSAEEGARLVDEMGARYGEFSFSTCLAHGSEKGFSLGKDSAGSVEKVATPEEEEIKENSTTTEVPVTTMKDEEKNEQSGLQLFTEALARNGKEGAPTIMVSCSTGKGEDPVAAQMARIMKKPVIAPDADTTGITYNAQVHGSTVTFDPQYSGAGKGEFKG